MLYASVARTIRESFPFVEAYAFGEKKADTQNIVLLASHSDLSVWKQRGSVTRVLPGTPQTFEQYRVLELPAGGILLTDDHAPTDTQLTAVAEDSLPSSVGLYWSLIGPSK